MSDRRSFLGALAALVAAPFVAKAEPTTFVTRWQDHPVLLRTFEFYDARSGRITPVRTLSGDEMDRAVARLRDLRRLA